MSVAARVRKDDHADEYCKNCLIRRKGSYFVIYSDAGGYSQTSGQNIIKGKSKRGLDDQILKFATIESACRWLENGEQLLKHGKDIFGLNGYEKESC